jgi:hypothetical protein
VFAKLALSILLLFAAFLGVGFWFLRKSRRAFSSALAALDTTTIAAQAQECVEVFATKLNTPLSFENYEESARTIDRALKDIATTKAFAKLGEQYNYLIAIGCFLGELVRRNSNAVWKKEANQAPYLVLYRAGVEMKISPFSKVQKYRQSGDEGDLYAYVALAVSGAKAGSATVTG